MFDQNKSTNQYELGKMDSSNLFQLQAIPSTGFADYFALNMSFSLGRQNSMFNLTCQPSNMSQRSVGGFKMRKDLAISDNGDVIAQQLFHNQRQEEYGREFDLLLLDQSIPMNQSNVNGNLQNSLFDNNKTRIDGQHNLSYLHDPFGLPCQMTNSAEVDIFTKANMVSSATNKSFNKNNNNSKMIDFSLGESASAARFNNLFSLNISQMQNPELPCHLGASTFHQQQMLPISLVDSKMETKSEPCLDVRNINQIFSDLLPEYSHKQEQHERKNKLMGNTEFQQQLHLQENQFEPSAMKESSGIQGLCFEPFNYGENLIDNIQVQYPHSDDENETMKKYIKIENHPASKRRPRILTQEQEEQQHEKQSQQQQQNGSSYRQSRHKNVFKNFGGTLVRFIIYNDYFQKRVRDEFKKDIDKQKAFQDWLQTNIKLERKKDFQIAWTTFKTDTPSIKDFKALLRELSRDFFENFSFIYLINSKKISDMEIHLRSIYTYLTAINNPEQLERFKPV